MLTVGFFFSWCMIFRNYKMNHSWMYEDGVQTSRNWLEKLGEFKEAVLKHQSEYKSNIILCHCIDCNNKRGSHNIRDMLDHIVRRGFIENYTCWTWHGEHFDDVESSSSGSRILPMRMLKMRMTWRRIKLMR